MDRNGPKCTEMDRNGPKWTEMDQNGPKWTEMDLFFKRISVEWDRLRVCVYIVFVNVCVCSCCCAYVFTVFMCVYVCAWYMWCAFLNLHEIVEGLYFHCSLSVCLFVWPTLLVNKIPAERMKLFWPYWIWWPWVKGQGHSDLILCKLPYCISQNASCLELEW